MRKPIGLLALALTLAVTSVAPANPRSPLGRELSGPRPLRALRTGETSPRPGEMIGWIMKAVRTEISSNVLRDVPMEQLTLR